MPLYEFRCLDCNTKFSLVKSMREPFASVCPTCGSGKLIRVISGFAYHKSTKTIWEESVSPEAPGPDFYGDPRNIGRWTEKRFGEMGLALPSQIQEQIQAAREGELPAPLKDKL